jgi:serine/threonine protein kinase/Tol biopolymer transport system component
MSLSLGSHIGRYEILAPLGSGAMGQVYRARDTKLNRDVAIKVLLPELANDPDRLARLNREAQLLASVNHSNIAAIYGLEEEDGITAIVMELVEGPTLADRLDGGPLSMVESLQIARQIADALEAAHDQGIIHRDLKPANVKVRTDGAVKLLDFGLAKALDAVGASSSIIADASTLSTHATRPGFIVGTAVYMSPEQAAGRPVDKRSDVWTLGVVLFEMISGQRVFTGDSVPEVLASVLKSDPDWSVLPDDTPAPIRRLLRRCLEKDRRRRLADAADARLEIDEALNALNAQPPVASGPAAWWRAAPWALAAVLAMALAIPLVISSFSVVPDPPGLVRIEATLGTEARVSNSVFGAASIISPDGHTLAFVAERDGGARMVYVRRLEQLSAVSLAGTENADSPFFSPDGQWVAFFADGKLKKVAVGGGAAVTLCDAPNGRGGDWGPDGAIVFQPNATGGLWQVSSAGGTPVPLTTPTDDEVTHRWPQILGGGTAVLYTANRSRARWEDATLVVQQLPSGARTVVREGGHHGRYLESGHLVYVNEGLLFAAPFDLSRLAVTGPPVPALDTMVATTGSGGASVAVSRSGTVVYLPRQPTTPGSPIVLMERTGRTTSLWSAPSDWRSPQFSPDGSKLAVDINDGKQADVWVGDWTRAGLSRLTLDAADDFKPIWSPDGGSLVFASNRAAASNLYLQRADGGGSVQRLTESRNVQIPGSWHPSGRYLAFQENRPETGYDLMILPVKQDGSGWTPGEPTVFLASPSTEVEAMFSPDGRWVAYVANDTGREEVYVRPFPGPGGTWQISTDGGGTPTWSRTRREIIYRTPANEVMAVGYTVIGDSFRPDKPARWAEGRIPPRRVQRAFDLHPDGERIVVAPVTPQTASSIDHVMMIFNFFDELRRIAPRASR